MRGESEVASDAEPGHKAGLYSESKSCPRKGRKLGN